MSRCARISSKFATTYEPIRQRGIKVGSQLGLNGKTGKVCVSATKKKKKKKNPEIGRAIPDTTDRTIPPADPALAKLEELLEVFDDLSAKRETVGAVPELSRSTKKAARLVEELGTVYKFDSIRLPHSDNQRGVKSFSELKSAIVIAYQYYERLEFYLTAKGMDYLRGVVQDQAKWFGGEEGLISLKHNFGERIDPLAAVRYTFEDDNYLSWAEKI